jgi:hypothetical protein
MTSTAATADEPAAITDDATGRQRGIELAVHGWPSTGNFDWPLTGRQIQVPDLKRQLSRVWCQRTP